VFPGKTDSLTAPYDFVLIHVDALLRFYIWVRCLVSSPTVIGWHKGERAGAGGKGG
jgi:hypothetical protein